MVYISDKGMNFEGLNAITALIYVLKARIKGTWIYYSTTMESLEDICQGITKLMQKEPK